MVISKIVLPNGSYYSFLYDYYGEVTQMTLPTGGVVLYKWLYPTSCSDPTNLSGAITWGSGASEQATIYRRLQERDEYANVNGLSGGLTGKIVYPAPTSLGSAGSGPDTNHPTRSGGYGVEVEANTYDGSSNQLRSETHWFYGDPSKQE
jgi:hypothetical protein